MATTYFYLPRDNLINFSSQTMFFVGYDVPLKLIHKYYSQEDEMISASCFAAASVIDVHVYLTAVHPIV